MKHSSTIKFMHFVRGEQCLEAMEAPSSIWNIFKVFNFNIFIIGESQRKSRYLQNSWGMLIVESFQILYVVYLYLI